MPCSTTLIARLRNILSSGQLTNNKWTLAFEKSFKEEFNLKGQCIAVNGCQNGLFLTLVALGVHRPLLPDFTFCSTAHAAYYACRDFKVGDCDSQTFNLIPKNRPECDCIIGTHIFGNPCDCQSIHDIANEHQIPVVYDAAHAIGAKFNGASIGDMGTASVFSLSPTKQVVASEGGVVVTSNACLADKLRKLRNYGNESSYDVKTPGLNARMSEIHACFALESLSHFKANQAKRMLLVDEYLSHFGEEITQKVNPDGQSSWKDFSILAGTKREKVCTALSQHKIEFKQYFRPISALTCYQGWQTPQPNAKAIFESIIQVPLHCNMETEDCRRIAKVVLGAIGDTSEGRGVSVHGMASTVRPSDSRQVANGRVL